ncbi:MAG: hypothetical protein L0229_11640 [Blastocatellia bacterium]|nr:hypothetical protein [Blastocatellia bacterium]
MKEIYKGIVRGGLIELENETVLPEGTRVRVIPEERAESSALQAWLQEARRLRAQLPVTGDSVEILRQIRQERTDR